MGCQIVKDGVKAQDYLVFICNLLRHYNMDNNQLGLVIFVDNASAHTVNIVKEKMDLRLIFLYNASYSPMLNPIEEFFSKFKKIILKNSTLT